MSKKTRATKPGALSNLDYVHTEKKLWLNPSYQRGSVWTLSQKQLFIDSLMRDFDIPKLYFREIDKKGYEYEVVDGQQRLLAVFEYMADGFKMPGNSDPVDTRPIASKRFSELHTSLQMKLRSIGLDIVVFNSAYTDEDIEETFLRLQNGTPLNAAEKRRAIPGAMRDQVAALAKHKVFVLCAFSDKRYAYEDAAAKTLHLLLAGTITDIRPHSIENTYKNNSGISPTNSSVVGLQQAYNFLRRAFRGSTKPALKKYSVITLAYLATDLLDAYDLSQYAKKFGKAYLDFEVERLENEDLPEDKQDSQLAAYTDAARADSIQDLRFRHDFLKQRIIASLPDLAVKDPRRGYSVEQRSAIFFRDKGVCKGCKKKCKDTNFHIDHVVAHSKGGSTSIRNGQLVCPACNLSKGSQKAKAAGVS